MLRLEAIRRTHEGASAPAVRDVDLHVRPGEVMVVVGPSGCGKSSILRLIAGLDAPDAGKIVLDGRDLRDVPPERRDVAMVFQGYALYPHLSARGNMEFPLRMRKVSKTEQRDRVERAAELLEIKHLLDRKPDQLSGGERQRVAMGRALVREPKVFLFDEPLSNLDAALRTTLRAELAGLLRRLGATAIYVTHDQVEAMTVGHRVAVMKKGEVEQIGSPREVYTAPETLFVASFLGSPSINVVPIEVGTTEATALGAPLAAPRTARHAAIRPEHVVVGEGEGEGASWRGTVRVVEPLGGETILHCDVSGATIRVKEHGFSRRAPGDDIALHAPREAIAFFDEAGRRISGEAGA